LELGKLYSALGRDDFLVLKVMASLINRYEYVPLEVLERRAKVPPKRLERSLMKLSKMNALIKGQGFTYRLTFLGLDLIAIHSLLVRGVVIFVGTEIGSGKESDIYNAKTPEGRSVAIKFYRIGRTSFQKVSRYRSFLTEKVGWFARSITAAEREFIALSLLSRYTEYVPKVFGYGYHAVVMEYIKGVELQRYRKPLDPYGMLRKILEALRMAYLRARIVHGDLSEYNIVVSRQSREEKPYIIDWPQYVYVDDPLHLALLSRDIKYLIKFFKHQYGVIIDFRKVLSYVKGESDEI